MKNLSCQLSSLSTVPAAVCQARTFAGITLWCGLFSCFILCLKSSYSVHLLHFLYAFPFGIPGCLWYRLLVRQLGSSAGHQLFNLSSPLWSLWSPSYTFVWIWFWKGNWGDDVTLTSLTHAIGFSVCHSFKKVEGSVVSCFKIYIHSQKLGSVGCQAMPLK